MSQPFGTPLATNIVSVAPSRFSVLRSAQLRAVATRLMRKRPYLFIVLWVPVLVLLAQAGFPAWRIGAMAAIYALSTLHHTMMSMRAHCTAVDERTIFASNLVALTMQALTFALTGGLASPLLPSILGPIVGLLLAFGRSRESAIGSAYMVFLVLGLALLPQSWVAIAPQYPYNVGLASISILFALGFLGTAIVELTDTYLRAGEVLEKMREDVVRQTSTRTKSMEQIGAKVAHELKNPLAAIKGLVQLLERGEKETRSRERLAVIAEEVTRMEGILRDYLSFSRPLEDLKPEEVHLASLVDDVLAVLEARAEEADVRLTRSGGDLTLSADPRRLKEALLNLVANAIEATPPKGSVTVGVRAAVGGATVEIRDTGRGIAPEVLPRVGTPFFTTRKEGTGLGVVLARAVVQHHGGDMVFCSEEGRGTTVTLTLPRVPAARKSDGEIAVCG
jgi:signal transduction histidine kinase